MKKVTTNITFGQILFILLTVLFASLMFFYLGAKFGPELFRLDRRSSSLNEPLLPDEQMALELQQLLESRTHDFQFQDILEKTKPVSLVLKKESKQKALVLEGTTGQKTETHTKKQAANLEKKTEKMTEVKPKQEQPKVEPKIEVTEKKVVAEKIPVKKEVISKDEKQKEVPPVKITTLNNGRVHQVQPQLETNYFGSMAIKTGEPRLISTGSTEEQVSQTSGSGLFRLQLGAYSEKSQAEQALQDWKKRGYTVRIVETSVPGKGEWYRLHIGSYSTQEIAMNAQQSFMKNFRQSTKVVQIQ